jgi:hypothetical protein
VITKIKNIRYGTLTIKNGSTLEIAVILIIPSTMTLKEGQLLD